VDGNNVLRASMVDSKVNSDGIHYGGILQFFIALKILMKQVKYDYVYIVFDDSASGILRYKEYHQYKQNRDKNYAQQMIGDGEESDYWKRLNQTIASMQKYLYNKNKKKKDISTMTDEEIVEYTKKQYQKELVDENFDRERNIIMEYCEEMSIRVIFDNRTEGDDLIAYYVNHKKPEERIVIVSADQDLTQLISPTVSVYDRNTKKYLKYSNFQKLKGYPVENVLIKKIFCGDTSDNIGNIKGLSEARLFELMPEMKDRPVTVEEVKERAGKLIEERINNKKKPLQWHENIVNGVSNKDYDGDFYEINKKIIDLKKPLLTKSAEEVIESMMYAPMDPEGRSYGNLYSLIKRDNIEDLLDEKAFARFFLEFKELSDKERKRYEESLKD
jgi:5'-3' exonuclease